MRSLRLHLRVLTPSAIWPEQLTTIAEIADSYGICENHLMEVIHRLGLAAGVETVRGRNGGVRLLKRPTEINIGEIVRRMEPHFGLAPCFSASDSCAIGLACVLKEALGEARNASLSPLARHPLADLVGPRRNLAALPAMSAPSAVAVAVQTRGKKNSLH